MAKTDLEHAKSFNKLLKGKTIKYVSYLSETEAKDMGWYHRPLILNFTDGSCLLPMSDDEGNNGGAMSYADKNGCKTIYVI